MSITGKWNGFFELDDSYGPVLKGKKGYFEAVLEEKNGNLSGTCTDTHGFGVTEKRTASYDGSISGNELIFTKTYSKAIPIDAFGTGLEGATLNEKVHYSGKLDSTKNKITGTWRISLGTNPESDDFTSGSFEMNRIS